MCLLMGLKALADRSINFDGRARWVTPFCDGLVFALVTLAAAVIMGSGNAPFWLLLN